MHDGLRLMLAERPVKPASRPCASPGSGSTTAAAGSARRPAPDTGCLGRRDQALALEPALLAQEIRSRRRCARIMPAHTWRIPIRPDAHHMALR